MTPTGSMGWPSTVSDLGLGDVGVDVGVAGDVAEPVRCCVGVCQSQPALSAWASEPVRLDAGARRVTGCERAACLAPR